MVRLTRFIFFMNLCEKTASPINKDGRFCSLRMTMFFAGVRKDFYRRDAETQRGCGDRITGWLHQNAQFFAILHLRLNPAPSLRLRGKKSEVFIQIEIASLPEWNRLD